MSGAPIKKMPASPRVSQPSIPVADRGGEEVNLDFGNFGAGRSNQLREQSLGRSAGHDREFSLGNKSHMGPLLYHIRRLCFILQTHKTAVLFRIQTAKEADTRTNRIQQFIEML